MSREGGERHTQRRVLLLAPSRSDAASVRELLAEASVLVEPCAGMADFCSELQRGAGALVVVEEALGESGVELLGRELSVQPSWSDLPVLLLARPQGAGRALQVLDGLGRSGSTTILERPLHPYTLLSAVRVALRARARQYGLRDVLEDRARLLAAERAARDEAERASRHKDEFLAMLSHELRTPLSAILGWSQLALRQVAREGEVGRALEVIERNARAQSRIIEDLLDMSRIVAGKVGLEPAPLELGQVVRSALAALQPAADAKGVRLELRCDGVPWVRGDRDRLQQVAANLIGNAVKFTPAGGTVEVRARRAGAEALLEVEDDGQGIAPEALPLVFDHFRQADASSARRHSGLGLGLSIVKRLVELHGGRVAAASDGIGRGSRFRVTLPAIERPSEAPAGAARRAGLPAEADLDGLRVLVVDDEPDGRELARSVLEQAGARVRTAASAAEALEAFRRGGDLPQVVVSDIGMPGADGYAFLAALRALPPERGGDTPALALTAFVSQRDEGRVRSAGFLAHLAKPFEPEALVALVRSCAAGGLGASTSR